MTGRNRTDLSTTRHTNTSKKTARAVTPFLLPSLNVVYTYKGMGHYITIPGVVA